MRGPPRAPAQPRARSNVVLAPHTPATTGQARQSKGRPAQDLVRTGTSGGGVAPHYAGPQSARNAAPIDREQQAGMVVRRASIHDQALPFGRKRLRFGIEPRGVSEIGVDRLYRRGL